MIPAAIEVRLATSGDAALLVDAEPNVFDDPVDLAATRAFLASDTHHLAIALAATRIVGMASAVSYIHPDKPAPELWINEVAVAELYRRRRLATRLLDVLAAQAEALGCSVMWVLTERGNAPARALYAKRGAVETPGTVMYEYPLGAAPTRG